MNSFMNIVIGGVRKPCIHFTHPPRCLAGIIAVGKTCGLMAARRAMPTSWLR